METKKNQSKGSILLHMLHLTFNLGITLNLQ